MGDTVASKISTWKFLSTRSLSDHFYIYFSMDMNPKRRYFGRPRLPRISDINTEAAKQKITSLSQLHSPMDSTNDIDEAIQNLTSAIQLSLKSSIVNQDYTQLKHKSPWWKKNLWSLRFKLREAQKMSRISEEMNQEFRKVKAIYQKEIRKAKSASWKRFC